MNANALLSKAVFYNEKFGWNVFPTGLKDDNGTFKKPIGQWKKYLTEKTDFEEIEKNFSKRNVRGIAVTCGEISGIIVVDIDPKNGGTTDGLDLPETLTEKTGGGGLHFYYKWRKGLVSRKIEFTKGVDILSTGGYVICAPSLHHDDVYYEWVNESADIADAPAWLEENVGHFVDDTNANFSPAKYATWEDVFYAMAYKQSGGRDNSALVIAGWLSSHPNISRAEALKKMEEWWSTIEQNGKDKYPFKNVVEKYDRYRAKDAQTRLSVTSPSYQTATTRPTTPELRRPVSKDGVPGAPYKDETNVFINLRFYFKQRIRYNEFARQIELDGKAMEDSDIMKIVYFMQTEGKMPGIHAGVVRTAIQGFAVGENTYNEPIDWLDSLVWDGKSRLETWLPVSANIKDNEYHRTVGMQWFMNGVVRRLYYPGCIWDYVLVLIGKQKSGKTSFFRILGGPWYKCFTGNVDDKDFYLKCRGTAILDLDEGNALSKSDSIKIKSIITETHDEYRAPYDATTKKYPRQFAFSMSANNEEPFKDATGNRRYLVVDMEEKQVNFKWMEENRDQLYAEAIYKLKNKIEIPEVPEDISAEKQEDHRTEDSWTDAIVEYLQSINYKQEFTVSEVYLSAIMKNLTTTLERLDKRTEMRIAEVLRKVKCEKRRRTIEKIRCIFWSNPFYDETLAQKNPQPTITAQKELENW